MFGIDGFQALHLAMQGAGLVLESAKQKLEWLGQTEDLGMPRFLPWLPKAQQARLDAIVERELTRWVRRAERAHKAKTSKRRKQLAGPSPDDPEAKVRVTASMRRSSSKGRPRGTTDRA